MITTGAVAPGNGSIPAGTCTLPFIFGLAQCSINSATINGSLVNFSNFNVISFGSFTAATGDIEGRLAVQGSVTLGSGYAIGTQISTADTSSTFSLIAGDLSWSSGALYPDGSAAAIESALVADAASVPSYLQDRVDTCTSSDCLASAFSAAFNCFSNLQSSLNAVSSNVDVVLQNSAIQVTCSDSSAYRYVASITSDMLAGATWYNLINCSSNAQWIFNIGGSSDVSFHGSAIPVSADNVIYNVLGSGRTISVNTGVNGAILAPSNTLNQTGGVIRGVVIVGNVEFALQINRPSCAPATGITDNQSPSYIATASANGVSAFVPSIIVLLAALALMF